MYTPQATIGLERHNRLKLEDLFEQFAELILTRRRHQKVPKGAKAATLVRISNGIMLTKDFLKHLALPAFEPGHTLAHPAVELPKVVLNLAKISQQSARGVGHLQKQIGRASCRERVGKAEEEDVDGREWVST